MKTARFPHAAQLPVKADDTPTRRKRRRASFRTLVKRAMLNVYGAICQYRQVPIDPEHASVDHVIPSTVLTGDAERRAEVLARFEYQAGDADPMTDFRNLLLTDQHFNREKWHHVDGPWEPVIRKGLAVAAENAERVEREFRYLTFEDAVGLMWGDLPAAVRTRANVARLFDTLAGEARRNPAEEEAEGEHVFIRRPEVSIHAVLPAVERPEGRICVTFARLGLRDSARTLTHEQIVRTLLPGFGSAVSHDHRPFIIYVPDDGEVTVQLGSDRFPLSRTAAGQLCDAVDRLAVHYLGAMRRLETRVFESLSFPPAPGGVVLGTMSLESWSQVVRHARAHQEGADSRGTTFRLEGSHAFSIAGPVPNDPEPEARARIRAEPVWSPAGWGSVLQVRVCWDVEAPPQLRTRRPRESHYRTQVRWSAARTIAWFRDSLLPAMEPPRSRWPFARRVSALPVSLERAVRRRTADAVEEGSEFTSRELATAALERMQRFFSVHGWRSVSSAAQRGLYDFLLWSLENSGPENDVARYVAVTFPSEHRHGVTEERIRREAGSLQAGQRVPAGSVDYTLRCVLKVGRDGRWRVPPFEMLDRAEECLRTLCDEHRAMEYLDGLREPS